MSWREKITMQSPVVILEKDPRETFNQLEVKASDSIEPIGRIKNRNFKIETENDANSGKLTGLIN